MELKFLKSEKNSVEVEFSDVTLIEILRVYLNRNSDVTFAAWKKDHPTVNPVLKVETKSKDAKTALKDAVKAIVSDLDDSLAEFKKLK